MNIVLLDLVWSYVKYCPCLGFVLIRFCCLYQALAMFVLHGVIWMYFLQRITAALMHKNEWFRKGYSPAKFEKDANINLDDIDAVFSESNVR